MPTQAPRSKPPAEAVPECKRQAATEGDFEGALTRGAFPDPGLGRT